MFNSEPHILIIPSWYPSRINPVAGIFFKEQAEALKASGLSVGVVFPEQRSVRTIGKGRLLDNRFQCSWRLENNIPVFRCHGWIVPKMDRLNRWLWIYRAERLFRAYMGIFGKPDILHAHSAVWAGVAAKRLSDAFQIPYLITEHYSGFRRDLISAKDKPALFKAFGSAREVLTVSDAMAMAVKPFLHRRGVRIVPNIVNSMFFEKKRNPQKSTDDFTFLSVAVLSENKGIEDLLRAFAMKFKAIHRIRLHIGGEGPIRPHLERVARLLKIDRQVRFLGALSRERVVQAMQGADAFVLPSHSETFGVVLIEAMATGMPVISTRSGGPEEFVGKDVGILTLPGNVPELASALESIYRNRKQWRARCTDITRYVRDRFSAERVISHLKEIYEDILSVNG